MKYKLFAVSLLAVVCLGFSIRPVRAEELTDWVIRDFQSEIRVNQDSSLDITEKITADCGNLPGKHGIFRTIPYLSYGQNGEEYKTPISLSSITDAESNDLIYQVVRDRTNHTISWKIGDPKREVRGENSYVIKYHVDNAIRQSDGRSDELYWNLNGNFWQLPIDKFSASVVFPGDLSLASSQTNIYAGQYGSNLEGTAQYSWDINVLKVSSARKLQPGEGITLSVTLPKGYFIPYVPGFLEMHGEKLYLMLPLLVLVISLYLWSRYGRDPRINWAISPEFEVPEKLQPIEYGLALSDGIMKSTYLTAAIIALAVKKQIKIIQIDEANLLSKAEYELERMPGSHSQLTATETLLLDTIFADSNTVKLSSLKNRFYLHIPEIEKEAMKYLEKKQWVLGSSKAWMGSFLAIGLISLFVGIILYNYSPPPAVAVMISAVILIIFSPLMSRRSSEGALLLRRLKGFEMYIKKAEKYRQKWLEKQNIFEMFLPYAIIYGVAKEWMKKMKDIYGEENIANYHPVWFYGYNGSVNLDSLSANIDNVSHNISTTLSSSPSSSGSGGGGFSGGGGGGGGGGGW